MTMAGPYARENMWKHINTDDRVLRWALLNMYLAQTPGERTSGQTKEQNDIGYNAVDAEFGTSLGLQVKSGRTLTEKQKSAARKMLRKYASQLAEVANANWEMKQQQAQSKSKSNPRRSHTRGPNPSIVHTNCKRCGEQLYASTTFSGHPLSRICSKCATPEEEQEIFRLTGRRVLGKATKKHRNPLVIGTAKNGPEGLYKSFHGNQSKGTRKVRVWIPGAGDRLVKIGRLTELRYTPEEPSEHTGTEFFHKMGDTGRMVLKKKPILATGPDGKGLFVIDDGASTKFTDRGLIG